MARMNSGTAVQDFSALANIDYSRLPEMQRLGREREYQSQVAKGDRVRAQAKLPALKEMQANNLLKKGTEGAISGILASNPQLMQTLDAGTDSEQVNKAYKKFVDGNSGLADNAILSQFLTQADTGMKEAQALKFQQQRLASSDATQYANALARLSAEQNEANKSSPVRLSNEEYAQFKIDNPDRDFNVKPVNVGGNILNELGSERFSDDSEFSGSFMTVDQYNQLVSENKGSSFKRTPVTDESGNVIGYNVEESYADTDEVTYDSIFTEESAKRDAQNLSDRKKEVRDWYADKRPKVESNIQIYDSLIRDLKAKKISIGGITEFVPDIGTFRDSTRALFNSKGQDAVDRVRLVVFQSLKDILGGAFSAQEANRLSLSAYNPQLGGTEGIEDNILRLEMANKVLRDMQAVKMAEFNAYQAGQQYFGPSAAQILKDGNDAMLAQFPIGSDSGVTAEGNTFGGLESVSGDNIKVKKVAK